MNQVKFGNAGNLLNSFLTSINYSKVAVLVDENTKIHCLPHIQSSLENPQIIEIQAGEVYKNIDTCSIIWNHLTQHQFSRNDLLINLGGGVIGDMGGFCAATYKRGIDFINIPTTLLSQVDASIGGKLGIDFNNYKNQIGLFTEPLQVIVDTTFLSTLPERQVMSGFAEIIKHCLIQDQEQWQQIKSLKWPVKNWDSIIENSISIKKRIVEVDYKESGLRKILNFGHTLGHAIESYFLTKESPLLHGEAIAIGMILETWLSETSGGLSPSQSKEIVQYISNLYPSVRIEESDQEEIIRLVKMDKKNLENKIMFSLLEDIGSAVYDINIYEDLIVKSIERYRNYQT